jgi:hypothetical protein
LGDAGGGFVGAEVGGCGGEADGKLGVVKEVGDGGGGGLVVVSSERLGGGGADGGILVAEGGDEFLVNGLGALLGDLLEGEDAGGLTAVLLDVLVGGDAEAEGAEEHGGSLECADLGEGAGVVEVLVCGVHSSVDELAVGLALSVDDGHEDVFAGVVAHLPEGGGGGEGDLGLLVVEHAAERRGEVAVFGLAGGEDGCGADVEVGIVEGGDDHLVGAGAGAEGADGGEGLDTADGVLRVVELGGEDRPGGIGVFGDGGLGGRTRGRWGDIVVGVLSVLLGGRLLLLRLGGEGWLRGLDKEQREEERGDKKRRAGVHLVVLLRVVRDTFEMREGWERVDYSFEVGAILLQLL